MRESESRYDREPRAFGQTDVNSRKEVDGRGARALHNVVAVNPSDESDSAEIEVQNSAKVQAASDAARVSAKVGIEADATIGEERHSNVAAKIGVVGRLTEANVSVQRNAVAQAVGDGGVSEKKVIGEQQPAARGNRYISLTRQVAHKGRGVSRKKWL